MIRSAVAATAATVSGVLGGRYNLFDHPGSFHHATVRIDTRANRPADAEVLHRTRPLDAIVRFSRPEDSAHAGHRTLCIKITGAYGTDRDQDFLLVSSADGAPMHHAVVPAAGIDSRLYSSLWLYRSGLDLVAFGARAQSVARADRTTSGDRFDFLISGALRRFRTIGTIVVGDPIESATWSFAGNSCGGGLQALPPVNFYRA